MVRNRRSFVLALVIAALIVAGIGIGIQPGHAASPITTTDASVKSEFLKAITFTVKAESTAGKIISARVLISGLASNFTTVKLAEAFTPASSVDLTVKWETFNERLYAWTLMRYSWEIVDDAGNSMTTPVVDFEYEDNTHDWQSLKDDHVKLFWFGLDKSAGQAMFKSLLQGYKQISEATNYTPDEELRAVIYPDQESFINAFPEAERAQAGNIGGETIGAMTVQWYIAKNNFTRDQVLPHEFAHAFLNFRMQGRISAMPTWVNEGQAMNNELVGIQNELQSVRARARAGTVLRFSDMESNPIGYASLEDTNYWYSQATSMVYFLFDKYGREVLGKFVDSMNAGKNWDDTLLDVTGMTMKDYEIAWRKWVGAPALSEADYAPTPTFEPLIRPTKSYDKPTATP